MGIRLLVVAALFCILTGCAKYRVTIADSDPTDIQHKEKTMHAYLWGAYKAPLVLEAECEGEGVNDVEIVDNLGYDLLSLITLGIWKPVDVRYRCKAPNGSGSTPLPVPNTQ